MLVILLDIFDCIKSWQFHRVILWFRAICHFIILGYGFS